MEHLRKILGNKDKKAVLHLTCGLLLGIILLIMSSGNGTKKVQSKKTEPSPENKQIYSVAEYEVNLEKRLEETLKLINNAGDVKVMLTLAYGKEIVVAEDTVIDESKDAEQDKQGNLKESLNRNSENKKIIIKGKNGADEPLVLKELEPKIEGIIIVAQGGDDVYVKDCMIKAAQAILNVEAHKIQVFKMTNREEK